MAILRERVVYKVEKETKRKKLELKAEKDLDLDQQAKELFSPAKYKMLPKTIELMAKKELKAKDEKRKLKIQRDHVFANARGSRAKPISPGVKYAAEKSRRHERVLKIAKEKARRTFEALHQDREKAIRHVELSKEDAELEEIIRSAQSKRNSGKNGDRKIVKKASRVGSSGKRPMGLVRLERKKNHINSKGMH